MKKLVLFFAVIVAVSLSSCGKKAAPAAATADTTVTAAPADTTVAAAPADTAAAPVAE
jgi:hypothetical protein